MSPEIEPLTKTAFAPFGDVIQVDGAVGHTINQGFAERLDNLVNIDVADQSGKAAVSIAVAQPRPLPIKVELMERHPLGSQLFFPLQNHDWLVLVASDPGSVAGFRAFRASGRQGVNFARNTWHHPLLVLEPNSHFLVVDRKGAGTNLEEVRLDPAKVFSIFP